MRILFTRFPLESAHGGAERQTLSLMKGLSERGHAVAFLGSCPVLLEETAKLRLPHAKLEIGPPPVTKWDVMNFLWRKKKMRQWLEAALEGFHDLDTIVMLSLSEKLLLTDAAVKKGINVLWVEHDRVGRWLTKNPWLSQLRGLSGKVTTVCVSELSRKLYLDLGWDPEKVIAIPNGIAKEALGRVEVEDSAGSPPPSPLPTGGGDARILKLGCVARLSPEKGVDVLIQAVGKLPDVDLTIIGKGSDENYLRQLAGQIHQAEMQTAERIRTIHHVNDLASFYRSIDALVLPSRDNDPFGLVAAEAMACGTPVIVTDQCGIAGYLTHGEDVLIVSANSEQSLRTAIQAMKDNILREKLSAGAKKTVESIFLLKMMIDAYEKIMA